MVFAVLFRIILHSTLALFAKESHSEKRRESFRVSSVSLLCFL